MTLTQRIKLCFTGFIEDGAPESAAAISFYAMISLPPLVVLLVSSAGLLIKDQSFQAYLIRQAGHLFGPSGSEVLSTIIIQSAQSSHGLAALLGFVTLLFAAGGLHAQLQAALNKIWNIQRDNTHFFHQLLGDRLVATLTVAATGILLIASLFLTTFLTYASKWLNQQFNIDFITVQRTQAVTSFFLLTAMVALLYKLLPDARVAWRDVWKGAILTSVLFSLTRQLMALYLANAGFTVSYGQAGTVVLLLLWIYFSALIFLFGAEWTSVEALVRGRDIVAKNMPIIQRLERKMTPFPLVHFTIPDN